MASSCTSKRSSAGSDFTSSRNSISNLPRTFMPYQRSVVHRLGAPEVVLAGLFDNRAGTGVQEQAVECDPILRQLHAQAPAHDLDPHPVPVSSRVTAVRLALHLGGHRTPLLDDQPLHVRQMREAARLIERFRCANVDVIHDQRKAGSHVRQPAECVLRLEEDNAGRPLVRPGTTVAMVRARCVHRNVLSCRTAAAARADTSATMDDWRAGWDHPTREQGERCSGSCDASRSSIRSRR